MRKIILLCMLFSMALFLPANSQILNQSANWPNANWTVTGSYSTDPNAFEADPTISTNFAFDDDAAGNGHDDSIAAESPVIDLTPTFTAGETWLKITVGYAYLTYSPYEVLQFEYYDAGSGSWVSWENKTLPSTDPPLANNYCNNPKIQYTTEVLDVSGFTATQLSGFRYRIFYDDNPNGAAWYYGFCFDAPTIVSYLPPACLTPTNLIATNVTASTADLGWTENGNATNWEVLTAPYGSTPPSPGTTGIAAATNPFQTIGLTPNMTYDFYVRANCGSGRLSAWVGPYSFMTECVTFSLPVCENFDTAPVGSQSLPTVPNCWSFIDTGLGYGYVTSGGTFFLYNAYNGTDYMLISPEILSLGSGNNQIQFDADANAGYQLIVGTMSDPTDAATFSPIETVVLATSDFETHTVLIPSSTDSYIALKHGNLGSYRSFIIDNICIEEVPTDYIYLNGSWSPANPNGISTANDNITVMNGTATFTQDIELNNLVVQLGATLKVEKVMTLEGDLTNNGFLIFVSTATGNGELDVVQPTSTIIGDVTVERYMQNKRSYRMVSSAVTTTTSIHSNWQEGAMSSTDDPAPGFGTHITGSTTDQQNGLDSTQTGNPSMYTVDVANQQFVAVSNTDVNTLTAGEPYLLFVRGNRNINLGENEASSQTVLRATGSLFSGTDTQNFPTATTNDFVMFGNPYQSAVDLTSVFANSTNVNTDYYYVYDPTLGTYGAYVTVSLLAPGVSPNQYLQPGQGAQVLVTGAGGATVVFNENDKAPGQFTNSNRIPISRNNMLTVQLYTTENFNTGGPVHDSFGIIFAEGNDNGITSSDAVKPMNFYENLGIDNNGTYLSLEHRGMPQPAEVYPLYSTGYNHSAYTLKLTIDGLEDSFLYLDDHFTGTSTPVEVGENAYSFSVDASNPFSIATDRFSIRTEQRLEVDDNSLLAGIRLFPNPLGGNTFYINAPRLDGEQLSVSISDLSGRRIFVQTLECRANMVTVPMGEDISSGVYMVTLRHGGEVQTYRLIKE